MDEIYRKVLSVNHFYYCLTVALKLYRNGQNNNTRLVLNCFMTKWAKKAKENKIFPEIIESEIDWVLKVIAGQGFVIDAEAFFDNIYLKTKFILDGIERSG